MGNNQGQQYILVVMTNKDVYYIDKYAAANLKRFTEEGRIKFYETTDVKSKSTIVLAVDKISSMVTQGGHNV